MANFNLEDYDTVDSRIKKFYTNHNEGRIITELVSDMNKLELVVFKAFLFIDNTDIPVSTGYAYEKAGSGFVNKTSHIENCETSAIGRALANYNYSGDKRASREEMEKVQRHEQINNAPQKSKIPDEKDELVERFKALKGGVEDKNLEIGRVLLRQGNYEALKQLYEVLKLEKSKQFYSIATKEQMDKYESKLKNAFYSDCKHIINDATDNIF